MLIQYLFYFYVYAFLGWCLEVIFAAYVHRTFVNRGFLSGPLCPIYGVGACLILFILSPIQNNLFLLFIAAVIVTSFLEWITGFILEKIFHQKWWDYSHKKYNLHGYISLDFSLIWGIACVFIIRIFNPFVQHFMEILPATLVHTCLIISSIIFVIDITLTITMLTKLKGQVSEVEKINQKMAILSDQIGETISSKTIALLNKSDAFFAEHHEQFFELQQEVEKNKQTFSDFIHDVEFHYKQEKKHIADKKIFGEKRLYKSFPNIKNIKEKDDEHTLSDKN